MRRLIAGAALALAACGSQGKGGNAAAESNVAAPAAPAASAGEVAATVSFQPGEWETTTTISRMNISGMPAGVAPPTPPPVTLRYCMTPEQASRPNADVLIGKSEGSGCTFSDFSMTGGRLRGIVQCNQAGAVTRVTMDGRFTPTDYEINQQIQAQAAGVSTDMTSTTRARRVGNCPAGAK